jgi:hypothetical protein
MKPRKWYVHNISGKLNTSTRWYETEDMIPDIFHPEAIILTKIIVIIPDPIFPSPHQTLPNRYRLSLFPMSSFYCSVIISFTSTEDEHAQEQITNPENLCPRPILNSLPSHQTARIAEEDVRSARSLRSAKVIVQEVTPLSYPDTRKTSKPKRKTSGNATWRYRYISSIFANTYRRMIPRGRRPKRGSSKTSRSSIKRKKKYSVQIGVFRTGARNFPCLSETIKIRSKGSLPAKVRAIPIKSPSHVLRPISRNVGYPKQVPNPQKIQPKLAERPRLHGDREIEPEEVIDHLRKGHEPKHPSIE